MAREGVKEAGRRHSLSRVPRLVTTLGMDDRRRPALLTRLVYPSRRDSKSRGEHVSVDDEPRACHGPLRPSGGRVRAQLGDTSV